MQRNRLFMVVGNCPSVDTYNYSCTYMGGGNDYFGHRPNNEKKEEIMGGKIVNFMGLELWEQESDYNSPHIPEEIRRALSQIKK